MLNVEAPWSVQQRIKQSRRRDLAWLIGILAFIGGACALGYRFVQGAAR